MYTYIAPFQFVSKMSQMGGKKGHEHLFHPSWKAVTKAVMISCLFPPLFSQVRTSVLPDHKEPRADVGVSNYFQ